jgi:ribonuclease HII
VPLQRIRGTIAGVDEAGRGPLAGPVVAAAVILGDTDIPDLDDSKRLNVVRRRQLDSIIRSSACSWAIAMATVAEIDSLNIHHATLLAMRRAVLALRNQPSMVLVDGRFVPAVSMPARAEIGGDGRIDAIAAASILAKQARDDIMCRLHLEFPHYGFEAHKGYPTPAHRRAIQAYGIVDCHRRSFAPVRECLASEV